MDMDHCGECGHVFHVPLALLYNPYHCEKRDWKFQVDFPCSGSSHFGGRNMLHCVHMALQIIYGMKKAAFIGSTLKAALVYLRSGKPICRRAS